MQSEKANGIKCSTFGASSFERRQLATGDYSGYLQTWDVERLDVPVFSVKGHSSIINAVDGVGGLNVGYGAPELVTGSRDGHVKVWDVRQTEPVVSAATLIAAAPGPEGDFITLLRHCGADRRCSALCDLLSVAGRAGAGLGSERARLLGSGFRQRL